MMRCCVLERISVWFDYKNIWIWPQTYKSILFFATSDQFSSALNRPLFENQRLDWTICSREKLPRFATLDDSEQLEQRKWSIIHYL